MNEIISRVIRTTFLEERTARQRVDMEGFTIRWTLSNALELIFIVGNSSNTDGVPAYFATELR